MFIQTLAKLVSGMNLANTVLFLGEKSWIGEMTASNNNNTKYIIIILNY